jgi:hypothetical protein
MKFEVLTAVKMCVGLMGSNTVDLWVGTVITICQQEGKMLHAHQHTFQETSTDIAHKAFQFATIDTSQ